MNTKFTSLCSALALAAGALVFAPVRSQAGDFHFSFGSSCNGSRFSMSVGDHYRYRAPYPACDNTTRYRSTYGSFYGGVPHRYSRTYSAPYRVRTQEVNRCNYPRTAYNRYGRPYRYHVTVVTYRDFYSDGRCVTYRRECR